LRRALAAEGVPEAALGSRVLCLDSKGLIVGGRPGLDGEKAMLAADPSLVAGWRVRKKDTIALENVVSSFRPTILVGASGQPGAFTESIVREMLRHCARPIVLPISNPTDNAEAAPADLLRWTGGAAVVGTGSPFPPVRMNGATFEIGQGNNVLIFPGVGLGALAVEARRVTEGAFAAAGEALHRFTEISGKPGEAIYPPLSRLREVSVQVALAVGKALVDDGSAKPLKTEEVEEKVRKMVWEPVYRPYRPA
jgi:malate dehydrogenase (oxaloacetate-decarboxylating)